jgi:hypothetical protein
VSFCAVQNQDGSYDLSQVLDPATCTGLVLQEGADLSYFLRAFIDPSFFETSQYVQIFNLGFSLPVLAYIVAWGYQVVINFATKD